MLLDRAGAGVSRCYGTGGRDLKDEVGRHHRPRRHRPAGRRPRHRRHPLRLEAARPRRGRARAARAGRVRHPGGRVHGRGRRGPGRRRPPRADARGGRARRRAPGGAPGRRAAPAARRVGVGRRGARPLLGRHALQRGRGDPGRAAGAVYSNAPAGRARKLEGTPRGHACLDLGEEEFTRGRPHPMIDPEARAERLAVEAADPEVGVLLLDVVLGYASHPDPGERAGPADPRGPRRPPAARGRRATCWAPRPTRRCAAARRPRWPRPGVRLAPTNAAAARLAAATAG